MVSRLKGEVELPPGQLGLEIITGSYAYKGGTKPSAAVITDWYKKKNSGL